MPGTDSVLRIAFVLALVALTITTAPLAIAESKSEAASSESAEVKLKAAPITPINTSEIVPSKLRSLSPSVDVVKEDIGLILDKAGLKDSVSFIYEAGTANTAKIECSSRGDDSSVTIRVSGDDHWSQTLYMAMQRIGFYFPHPMIQISPKLAEIKGKCGQVYKWNPAIKYAGFHFHTLHPNEWMHGFILGEKDLAFATVRWLARNQQNIFDLSLLKVDDEKLFKNLSEPFKLAKGFGIHAGVALGIAFRQQKSYRLISLTGTFFDGVSLGQVERNLTKLLKNVDVSFVNLESGTTEFTGTNYDRTIKWMNKAAEIASARNVAVFVKVHASSNQHDKKYGNYNFLPSFANSNVGILPHTIFVYGMADENAPVYGNKNFEPLAKYTLQEKSKRPIWFYPETSYFIALDIDVPLLLTDYLLTRANDTKWLVKNGIEGQLNFSTGQEVGYWLFDWTYTLLNNRDYEFDPMIGLKLLGEDVESWKKVVDYQHKYFIEKNLISIITFSDFGTELMPGMHQTLKRNLLSDLQKDKGKLQVEIDSLKEGIAALPLDVKIKNRELDALWNVTKLRLQHALQTRLALLDSSKAKATHLAVAKTFREQAQKEIDVIVKDFNRYPSAKIFERHSNPTAYQFGYAYTVKNLHYWNREEQQIKARNYRFSFMALYSLSDVLGGWVF